MTEQLAPGRPGIIGILPVGIGRRPLVRGIQTGVEEFFGDIITRFSKDLAFGLGFDAATISEEVAERHDTTLSGAHMVLLQSGLSKPDTIPPVQ